MGGAAKRGGMGGDTREGMGNEMGSDLDDAMASPLFGYVRLGDIASIDLKPGASMIPSENGALKSTLFLNVRGRDMGSFVEEAKERLAAELDLPTGYAIEWSGQYESKERADRRLMIVVPIVLLIIFVMLHFIVKSWVEAGVVMLSVPFALIGGVYLMWIYDFNWSVAVWVGFIALYGVAVQTGVVMVVYLHEALDRRLERGEVTDEAVFEATVEGSLLRVRPKIMTVATTVIGLLPLLWATGTGSDVMKPIAVPLIGGMVTSTIHVLLVTPIIFLLVKRRDLRLGRLKGHS